MERQWSSTHSSMAFVAPSSDDTAETISAVVAEIERRWNQRAAQLVGALVASCWAGVSVAVLLRTAFDANGAHRAGCVGVAAAISFLALLAAVVACHVFSAGGAGLTLGLMATGFAAVAGLLAVPGGPGAPNALFAMAAAATSAGIVRVIACRASLFAALACFAMTCLAAAVVWMVAAEPLPAIGAGLAATSLAMIEASPPISAMLARLSSEAPSSSPDQLQMAAIRAHGWLTSLVTAFSASAALGAASSLLRISPPGIVFAAVVGSVLMLRARTHQDVARVIPPVICGAVTLSAALFACAVRYPHHALHIAVLATALGLLALYLGFVGVPATGSPIGRPKSRTGGIFCFRDRRTADFLALRSVRRGAQRESVVRSARLAVWRCVTVAAVAALPQCIALPARAVSPPPIDAGRLPQPAPASPPRPTVQREICAIPALERQRGCHPAVRA